jgi:hypothetical protein
MELTQRESCAYLVFRRVSFSSESKAFGEGEQLIEATGTRQNESGCVQYDIVRHAIRVEVSDKAVVRPIVRERRFQIKTDQAEIITGLATGVVSND